MEYVKKAVGSSGVAKVGAVLGGTALGLNLLGGGGLNNLFGARQAGFAYPAVPGNVITVDASGAPVYGGNCNCYVTEKEMCLIRENSAQGAVIAKLEAEKYADMLVKSEVEPLKTRVCNLETAAAVNAARDQDFRRYVNAEFVHQPKASIKESIVVCKQCGCECECGCH